ncbi:hypothetical protein CfE428DRAFT_2697 [Chthoniobacter flavus Ellin428]|uniref:Uncharacterized protein n=1 Tax=Chthoniobacter flavus Ellin428 TaxID=497964 RepID=B4D1A9_9BACT|nr:hypothetical protein CfE428DRAFT_2697 [Chthoniobacter flavus Ellin428]TCO92766.1 hypothetical protein EV701_10543 [Chthoniobacter flavus]
MFRPIFLTPILGFGLLLVWLKVTLHSMGYTR